VNYDQDTCGPMARTVGDVELLHRIASGRNKTTADVSRSLRVGYLGKSISIEFVFFYVSMYYHQVNPSKEIY